MYAELLERELVSAQRRISSREMRRVIAKSLVKSAGETALVELVSLTRLTFKATVGTVKFAISLKRHGFSETAKRYSKSLLKKLKKKVDGFKELKAKLNEIYKKDKRTFFKEISKGFVLVVTMLAYAGGFDLEGGLPDKDIAFGGIGMHRNIFSHTILMPLFFEFSIRFIFNVAQEMVKRGDEGLTPP